MFADPHRPKEKAPPSAFERKSVASKFRPAGDPPAAAAAINTVSPPAPVTSATATAPASGASANDDTIQSINSLYEASLINIRQGADKNSVEYLNRVEANREFFAKALYVANKAESDAKYNTMKELNDDMGKLYSTALGKAYANSDPDNTIKFDYTIAREIIPLLIEKAQNEIDEFNIFDGLTAVYDDAPSHIQVLKHLYKDLTVDMFKELYPSSLSMNYAFFYPGIPNASTQAAEVTATASSSGSEPAPAPVTLTSPVSPVQPTAVTLPDPAAPASAPASDAASASSVPAAAPASEAAPSSAYTDTAAFRARQHPYYSDGDDIVAVYEAAIAKGEDGHAAALQARRMRKQAEAASGATSMAPVTATAPAPQTSASLSINIPKSKRPEEVQGWQIKESRSEPGLFYYYNPVTKKSSRTRPEPTGSNVSASSSATSTPSSTPVGSPKLGAQPAPSDGNVWEEKVSKTTGKTYYYNPKTKVSQWVPPNQVSSTPKPGSESVGHADGDQWEEKISKSTGKTYYYNPVTKVSQWDKPANVSASSSSLPGGWEEVMNSEGQPYYVQKDEKGDYIANSSTREKPVVSSLPAGWEEVMNSQGQPYYVQKDEKGEYIANSSTREKPVAAAAASNASVQADTAGVAPRQGMHWNAASGKWVDDVAPTGATISAMNKARQDAQKGGSRKKRKLTPRRRTMKN